MPSKSAMMVFFLLPRRTNFLQSTQKAAKKDVSLTLTGIIIGVESMGQIVFSLLPSIVVARIGFQRTMNAGLLMFGITTSVFSCMIYSPPGIAYFVIAFLIRGFSSIGSTLYLNATC
jgi:hypothetical protein